MTQGGEKRGGREGGRLGNLQEIIRRFLRDSETMVGFLGVFVF